jgi:hypothetical protein
MGVDLSCSDGENPQATSHIRQTILNLTTGIGGCDKGNTSYPKMASDHNGPGAWICRVGDSSVEFHLLTSLDKLACGTLRDYVERLGKGLVQSSDKSSAVDANK